MVAACGGERDRRLVGPFLWWLPTCPASTLFKAASGRVGRRERSPPPRHPAAAAADGNPRRKAKAGRRDGACHADCKPRGAAAPAARVRLAGGFTAQADLPHDTRRGRARSSSVRRRLGRDASRASQLVLHFLQSLGGGLLLSPIGRRHQLVLLLASLPQLWGWQLVP